MIANEVDQQATTTTNDSYPSINPSPSHLRDANTCFASCCRRAAATSGKQ